MLGFPIESCGEEDGGQDGNVGAQRAYSEPPGGPESGRLGMEWSNVLNIVSAGHTHTHTPSSESCPTIDDMMAI